MLKYVNLRKLLVRVRVKPGAARSELLKVELPEDG